LAGRLYQLGLGGELRPSWWLRPIACCGRGSGTRSGPAYPGRLVSRRPPTRTEAARRHPGWHRSRFLNGRLASRSSAKDLVPPDHDVDYQHQGRKDGDTDRQVGQQQAAGKDPGNEQSKRSHDHGENDAEPDHKRAPRSQAEWTDRLKLTAVVLR
jgi:hypothetical protein